MYTIVLDCETCPLDNEVKTVEASNMLAYDIGWNVCDYFGNVVASRSFINADIFLGEKDLMKNAFYVDKIPQYWKEIKKGDRILTSFYKIRKQMIEDMKEFSVKEVYCHNAKFDFEALNTTMRWLSKSRCRFYFPFGISICDTLKMSNDVLVSDSDYINFCFENGFITNHKKPRPRATAEVLYRYITKNLEFEEQHTAKEDCDIETIIMAYCYKMGKDMRKLLFE